MREESLSHPRIESNGKGYFIQNDLFQYWTPGTEIDNRNLYPASGVTETKYISQSYDIFCDLSLEFHEQELRLLHTDDVGIALVGGAGTGKTHALASLAGHWIRKGIFKADEILVITFTNSETRKIALGILEITGQKGTGVEVTGIDGFCFKLLCAVYGMTPRIFTENDRKHFIDLIFPFLSEENASLLCSFIDSNKMNKNIEPEEDFSHLRDTYIHSLMHIKVCDQRALAVQAAQAVTGNPGILFNIQQKYRCILIDDLQRMDKHQYDLLSRVIIHNIFIETDPGRIQKIVVSVDPLQREKRTYGNSVCETFLSDYVRRRFFLTKSWRVPGRILSSVSRLYGKERAKKKKVPKTHKKRGTHILLYRAKNPVEEAVFIKDTILSLVKKKKASPLNEYSWKDFGIFSREKEDLKEVAASLMQAHIPFTMHDGQSFTDVKPFHLINSFFHFILSERDVAAFADILLNLFSKFSAGEVKSIFLAGNRKDEPLPGLILRLYDEHILSDSQYAEISRLFTIRKKVKRIVYESGIIAGITTFCSGFPELDLLLLNFPEEKQLYLEYAHSCGHDIKKFLTEQMLNRGNHHNMQSDNKVQLSPFHCAKGFELPVLFIPGMEEGNCPLYNQSPDTEIGLFYSAITRVKERVYLSYAKTKSGEKREISSFIREMGSHVKEIDPAPVTMKQFEQGVLFY
jgi:DNA helicase-2/ATP-dependent DNA helicase PcrA